MFHALSQRLRRSSAPSNRRSNTRRHPSRLRRLGVESLEARQLLSATDVTFHVVNDAAANISYQYAADGAPQGSTSLVAANAAPRGEASTVAVEKTWVIDANRNVYVYDTSGGLLGSWSAGSMAGNATPEGIATNGTDVWIVDSKSDKVFKYTGAASRLSDSQTATSSFNLNSSNSNPKDIVTDGASLWVVDDAAKTDKVFKYDVTGSLVGSWTISSANKSPTGITIDPANVGDLWIADSGTDRVYQYTAVASRNSGSQAASASFALATGNTNPQGLVVAGRPWAEAPYEVEWIKQFGGADNDWGRGVSVDPYDNIYVSGAYAAPDQSIGGTPFVARFDTAGNTLWFQPGDTISGVYYEGVRIAADAQGNVFQMVGGGDVDPRSLRNYNPDGDLRWTTSLPGEFIFNVTVDNLGFAYLSTYEGQNVHVRKVEGDTGTAVWHETINTGGTCNSSGIAVDQHGNVYVAAYTSGSVQGPNADSYDGLLMKFNNDGVKQWAQQFGTDQADYAFQVDVDQFGNIYTSGQTYGSLGGPNAGARDQFLVKHDSNGNQIWSRQFGNTGDEITSASWVDPQGNVYRAMTAFGALGGAHMGDNDIVVVKYDPAGDIRWATQLGTSSLDAPVGGITGDSQGNLYITGRTTGSIGGLNAGNQDAFLIKLSPGGTASGSSLDSTGAGTALALSTDYLSGSAAPYEKSKRIAESSVDPSASSSSSNVQASNLNLLTVAASTTTAPDAFATSDDSRITAVDTAALDAAFADVHYVRWPKIVAEISLAI